MKIVNLLKKSSESIRSLMEEIFLLATTQMKQFISQMIERDLSCISERDETSTHLFSLSPKAPTQERDSKTYDSDDSFNGKTSGSEDFMTVNILMIRISLEF